MLSNGHGCALQYVMLHLTGYNLSLEDLKNFRQLDSITPGHPENHLTEGVEVTTGPLGQGVAQGVGLAMAEAHMASNFNKPGFDIFDNYTYVFCGDGCLQVRCLPSLVLFVVAREPDDIYSLVLSLALEMIAGRCVWRGIIFGWTSGLGQADCFV